MRGKVNGCSQSHLCTELTDGNGLSPISHRLLSLPTGLYCAMNNLYSYYWVDSVLSEWKIRTGLDASEQMEPLVKCGLPKQKVAEIKLLALTKKEHSRWLEFPVLIRKSSIHQKCRVMHIAVHSTTWIPRIICLRLQSREGLSCLSYSSEYDRMPLHWEFSPQFCFIDWMGIPFGVLFVGYQDS